MGVHKDFGQHQRRIDARMGNASCLGTIVSLVPCQTHQTLFGIKGKSDCHLQINNFKKGTERTDKSPVTWCHNWWRSTTGWVVVIATVIAVVVTIPHAGWRRQSWPPVIVSSAISQVGRCTSHPSHATTTPHWAKTSPTTTTTTTSTTLLPSRLL
jgi:hypothetical protein